MMPWLMDSAHRNVAARCDKSPVSPACGRSDSVVSPILLRNALSSHRLAKM
jgi:hypothetical protein